MSTSPQDPLPPELEDIGRLMRAERRQPSALELDELKRRVRRQAAGRSSLTPLVQKGSLLTSRLLITILIAFGIVLSGTGATLAIAPNAVNTGSTTSAAQYGSDDDDDDDDGPNDEDDSDDDDSGTPPPESGVGGTTASQDPPIGVLPEGPKSGVAPTTESGEAPRVQTAADRGSAPRLQPIRQQADQGESLPFTGLAAIPILVVGIGLLASGLVLRRRA
jgi:hypothetical protein